MLIGDVVTVVTMAQLDQVDDPATRYLRQSSTDAERVAVYATEIDVGADPGRKGSTARCHVPAHRLTRPLSGFGRPGPEQWVVHTDLHGASVTVRVAVTAKQTRASRSTTARRAARPYTMHVPIWR